MNETRVFSYKEAEKDFGYKPMSFEKGLDIEVRQYIEGKAKK